MYIKECPKRLKVCPKNQCPKYPCWAYDEHMHRQDKNNKMSDAGWD